MVSLFYGNRDNLNFVAYCEKDDVMSEIFNYLTEQNKENPYYVRTWTDNGVTHYDVGSWSEFFYSVPFYISY